MINREKKILVICDDENSRINIVLNIIKYLSSQKKGDFYFLIPQKNKKILSFLKKKKKKIIKKEFKNFSKSIKTGQFDWLLNIWSSTIYKKDFLCKFKHNLNLHPSYLPYNRGKDPYIWSIVNQTPLGVTIHKMSEKIDYGDYYVRKKIKLSFPFTGFDLYQKSLAEIYKLFIKNWPKIRDETISLKKYNFKKKLNLRNDLKKINYIDLDRKKENKIKSFVMKILSQDFPTFKQQVKIENIIYDVNINLKKKNKKNFSD